MDIMDIISQICNTAVSLYNTKWYQVIKRYKINKEFDRLSDLLYSMDIFEVSNYMISFLSAMCKEFLEESRITLKKYNLEMDFNDTHVTYNSVLKTVNVYDGQYNICYSIHHGTRIPSFILDKWLYLDKNIRDFYMATIIDAALVLAYD